MQHSPKSKIGEALQRLEREMVMKVWISKYALTKGIFEREVNDCGNGMVEDKSSYVPVYYHGNDWHIDKKSAISRAEEMRKKKIASLKKQIDKLEKMNFGTQAE